MKFLKRLLRLSKDEQQRNVSEQETGKELKKGTADIDSNPLAFFVNEVKNNMVKDAEKYFELGNNEEIPEKAIAA